MLMTFAHNNFSLLDQWFILTLSCTIFPFFCCLFSFVFFCFYLLSSLIISIVVICFISSFVVWLFDYLFVRPHQTKSHSLQSNLYIISVVRSQYSIHSLWWKSGVADGQSFMLQEIHVNWFWQLRHDRS